MPPAVLPQTLSGEFVDFEIPIAGGCEGPYVVDLLSGEMPDGLILDDSTVDQGGQLVNRHHIVGNALESGSFVFTIQVLDRGCSPYSTSTQTYNWTIAEGIVQIVGATPALVPAADLNASNKYTDCDAIPTTVYGQFSVINLTVAGGQPPYSCTIVDDPADPDDGLLPLGTFIAEGSCSISGTPGEVLSDAPFRFTVRVNDKNGMSSTRKFQWVISTPPIIAAATEIQDGQAGRSYADVIQVTGGVPPFNFELVDDVPTVENDQFNYAPPAAPTFPSNSGFIVDTTGAASNRLNADGGVGGGSTATYASSTAASPFGPMPPEGVFLDDSRTPASTITGVARRSGDYIIHAHAFSSLLPNSPGQHLFLTYDFTITPADPLFLDPSVTLEGVFSDVEPYSTLPEFEFGVNYNPDGGPSGLQMLASGGVPDDGFTDAPHASQRISEGSIPGTYNWTVNWDPIGEGTSPIPGVDVSLDGVISTPDSKDLVRQGFQTFRINVIDHHIPQNDGFALMNASVGPDRVIITDSSSGGTYQYLYYSIGTQRFDADDTTIRIRKFEPFSSGAVTSNLTPADMTQGTTVPGIAGLDGNDNPIGALLSGASGGDKDLDLLRCTINPTGWWDDMHGLNPNGARPFQHGDSNKGSYPYVTQLGSSYSTSMNWQPAVSCVDLPNVEGVAEDRSGGVYTDGGYCYHFEGYDRFGLFIIRKDASVYVPFAMETNNDPGGGGFGDGIMEKRPSGAGQNTIFRTVQMAVSPNGRIAAMVLKRTPTLVAEQSYDSRILLISLSGEKLWDGETYKIIDPGGAATGSTSGRYVTANSLALTNDNLYFLLATQTTIYYQPWSSYYIMRYGIESGDSAAHLVPSESPNGNWTLGSNSPMQTVFQHWYISPYSESYTYYGLWAYHRYWHENGSNFYEGARAPMPFRASRNGEAMAILAGPNVVTTLSTSVYRNFLWVDYDGAGVRQASLTARHATVGGSRGYAMSKGPYEYGNWGFFSGPTTGLEISDDGLSAAFVYTDYTGSFYASASAGSTANSCMTNRQNVVVCRTNSTDKWAGGPDKEWEVTDSSFAGSHLWRFGALAFTADGDGLVFWGGAAAYSSTSVSITYQSPHHYNGTFYACDLTASSIAVTSMVASSDGGSTDGAGETYTSGKSAFSPSSVSGQDARYGVIQPNGGFLSSDRNFMYIMDASGYSTGSTVGQTCNVLLGLNISTLDSGSINGHTNGRGFRLEGWPSRRGFMGNYVYYPGYIWYTSYSYHGGTDHGASMQAMSDNGIVFFGSKLQYSGPASSWGTATGGPVIPSYGYGCYGYGKTGMYAFNSNLGGDVAALHRPGDVTTTANSNDAAQFSYVVVSEDGTKAAWVVSTYYYYTYFHQERVRVASNLNFDTADGSLHGDFDANDVDSREVEASNGRAGECIAMAPNGTDVYYTFGDATNESNKVISRVRIDDPSSSWDSEAYASKSRQNVLYAGR